MSTGGPRWQKIGTALALLVGGLLVGPPAAPTVGAASDDIVAVVVEGTGYGHGRGLSQWGAYGLAVDHGKTWQEIVSFYYGGTEPGTVPAGQRIRVRLLGLDGLGSSAAPLGVVSYGAPVRWTDPSGVVRASASMFAREIGENTFEVWGSSAQSCPGSSALAVPNGTPRIAQGSPDATGVRQIQTFLNTYGGASLGVDGSFGSRTGAALILWQSAQSLPTTGAWDDDDAARARQIVAPVPGGGFTLLGTENTGPGNPVSFGTANGDDSSLAPDQTIGVCGANTSVTHYRGNIDVLSTGAGNRVVNDVKAEDYLRGVLPREVAASWGDAGGGRGANALRAQAVAARSYGLVESRSYTYDRSSAHYATTCDSTACQVYAGAATRPSATTSPTSVEHPLTDTAIAATANIVRRWPAGHPRAGQLVRTEFSASNGPRTAGGEFPPVNDIGDDTIRNPNHRWTRVIDADELAARYQTGALTSVTTADTTDPQYRNAGFDGIWFDDIVLNGSKRVQAWDLRGQFDLPSPGFTVRVIRRDTTADSFGLIGDSVGESVAAAGTSVLNRLIDGTFTSAAINASTNRCTVRASCQGSSGIEVAATLPFGLDLVVVELGYNDDPKTFASDIGSMMAALGARGVQHVAWVNLAAGRATSGASTYAAHNAALAKAATAWPNLSVLDWNDASRGGEARARWFSDGVHLSTTGQAEFALWLRNEVLTLAPSHYLSPPKQIELTVGGQQLVTPRGETVTIPPSAAAVAINVTTSEPEYPGVVTVWPCASTRRETSNLNNMGNDIVANNVIAAVDVNGKICLWSNVGTDIIVDVTGWFDGGDSGAGESGLVSVSPQRIVDSRKGLGASQGLVQPSKPLVVDIAGVTAQLADGTPVSVPADVDSVALNITSVNSTGPGYFTVWPCNVERKETSSLNFVPGKVVANGVVTAVDPNGQVCVYAHQPSDLVIDVQGWFAPSSAASPVEPVFTPTDPTRIVDTRKGLGAPKQIVQPAAPLRIPIHGAALDSAGSKVAVPTSATAVVINVVAVDTLGPGFVTVWPCNGARPTASNLNYVSNEIVANGVIAPINPDGSICLYTHYASDIVVDVAGWLSDGFVGATPKRFVDTRYGIGPAPV